MVGQREYPERPVVGVGGVVIRDGRALLIRRGAEPLKGQWSIPGGALELGETLVEGVQRELREETGLEVRVGELIEVFDRIVPDGTGQAAGTAAIATTTARPLYHFVIADFLCAAAEGEPRAGSDVTDVAFAREDELHLYSLTPTATRVLQRAFAMERKQGR